MKMDSHLFSSHSMLKRIQNKDNYTQTLDNQIMSHPRPKYRILLHRLLKYSTWIGVFLQIGSHSSFSLWYGIICSLMVLQKVYQKYLFYPHIVCCSITLFFFNAIIICFFNSVTFITFYSHFSIWFRFIVFCFYNFL